MTDGKRRAILIGGALAAVTIIVAGVLVLWPPSSEGDSAGNTAKDGPEIPTVGNGPSTSQVIDPFLKALSSGNAAEAAALTDNPDAARQAITALHKGVPAGTLTYTRKPSADPQPGAATVTVPVEATLKVASANKWSVSVQLARVNGKWQVKWAPTVLHGKLQAGQTIAVIGKIGQAGQPAVLGDDGTPIAVWEGSTAKPLDPKISPSLMNTLVGGASGGGTTDARYVAIVDAAGKDVETLFGEKPAQTSTEAVKSTLNAKIAVAAQNAVAKASEPTMIVAIKPSTGGILAVAQNEAASGPDSNPLSGQYAPGSAFKIVTAAAAIQQQGLTPDSPVACPAQATISGRVLKNDGFDVPNAKLRNAFARSCNTTFGQIAGQLPADGLRKAATQLGLNADYDIPGIKSELGKVEAADSAVQRVEDSIGQGKVVASPLGMALVAATVAAKKPVTPTLRKDAQTQVLAGYQAPPAAVLGQVQAMMGEVVQSGTATELKRFRSVHGKTGTAETENQGDNAHGWFVGFRGDVAFAVLVKDGKTSDKAVTVTAAFLSGF
ncbi:penicillin-binding transpeptidase domain-containing protein [Kibdelosporangium persicum]|uniref:Cell division protein FtsI n=1 Tax=Kibdelosporangium persicum TaxID=2698649 RepID=A0ABX2EX33_9PSEU|nr:penicillin-binding transpeptidase domain-containing protein [Kibdelosporangium persicum]NRN63549.1 Cell division protein FtsI [Kibdelosporangium persicum]